MGGQCHTLATIVQEASWAVGLIWMGLENLAPTRFQTMDCLFCSE